MFFRLWVRAPRTRMVFIGVWFRVLARRQRTAAILHPSALPPFGVLTGRGNPAHTRFWCVLAGLTPTEGDRLTRDQMRPKQVPPGMPAATTIAAEQVCTA